MARQHPDGNVRTAQEQHRAVNVESHFGLTASRPVLAVLATMGAKKTCSKRPRSAQAAQRRLERRMAVSVETLLLQDTGARDTRGFRQTMPISRGEVPLGGDVSGKGVMATSGARSVLTDFQNVWATSWQVGERGDVLALVQL